MSNPYRYRIDNTAQFPFGMGFARLAASALGFQPLIGRVTGPDLSSSGIGAFGKLDGTGCTVRHVIAQGVQRVSPYGLSDAP